MAGDRHNVDTLPHWAWGAPAAAALLVIAKFTHLVPAGAPIVVAVAALLLGAAVFASVHHAEVIALRAGEPFGSIVLAISVTVIEVALIVSLMLTGPASNEFLARDTVFATVMIVLNAVVGLCLVVGGMHHREQQFRLDASTAALSVLGTLSIITLVLPNFALGVPGPYYSTVQLVFVGAMSVILYAVFLFVQTIRHRTYFLVVDPEGAQAKPAARPTNRTTLISLGLLLVALAAVVLLAKTLAEPLERAVLAAGLPQILVGVVVAGVVLLPEGIAAVRAARANQLQISLNLALGSALATIGLTIPIVAVAALLLGSKIALGLGNEEMVLLLLTLFIGTVTLATGRTTILQGAVHLVIFAIFLLLSVVS